MPLPSGFSLWELLCTLVVAALVFATGVPAFESFVLDARLTADVNAWVLAVQVARTEAAKRSRSVILCPTEDSARCSDAGSPVRGWMVFVNLDDAFPPRRSAAEPLLYVHASEIKGSIVSNRPYYEFRPFRRDTNGTTVFCDRRGTAAAKAVIVGYTGRPRAAVRDADGRPLQCAGLT